MKTPSSTFKSIPPPADPRYPAANALYSTPPAVGEAAHTPAIPLQAVRIHNKQSGRNESVILDSTGHFVAQVTPPDESEGVCDKAQAAFIVRACNENAQLHALVDANVIARCDAQDRADKLTESHDALVAALRDCMDRMNHHDDQSVPEVLNAKAALDGLPESQWPFVTPGMEIRRAALNAAKS